MITRKSNTVLGTGVLRHQFHGTYSALIGIAFRDVASARDALVTLRTICGGWLVGKTPRTLVWFGSSETLSVIKAKFVEYDLEIEPCGWKHCKTQCRGAEIDSTAHSVDVGPSFLIDIPVVPNEQIPLV